MPSWARRVILAAAGFTVKTQIPLNPMLFTEGAEKIFVMLSEAKHLVFGDSSVASLPQNDRRNDLRRALDD